MSSARWSHIFLVLLFVAVALIVSFAALSSPPGVKAQTPEDLPPEHAAAVEYLHNLSEPLDASYAGWTWSAGAPQRDVTVPRPIFSPGHIDMMARQMRAAPSSPTDDLILRVNYAHDWVESFYESGHTIWITVTDGVGAIKAMASGETGPIPWWGGQSGFQTGYNVLWAGAQQPDLATGDWVYVALDGAQLRSARIGTIEGAVDVVENTVSGTIDVPWFTDVLTGSCEIWADPGPNGIAFTVDPDGGAYTCDFDDVAWDLEPGHMAAVSYQEPDGDTVYNTFEEPAPRIGVNKWANGQPAEGGNVVFYLQYYNEGGAPAEDVVITDTLQGMDYLSDTSGFSNTVVATSDGVQIVWDLGTVGPNEWVEFALFVETTALSGDIVTNTAQIATSNPYNTSDPGQTMSTWVGQVAQNDTHLNVGKGAWTGEPAPGYDFVYNVNVCNNGSTGSTPVTLTDTLPSETTLVNWWAQEPGWQEVASSDHLLVVSLPSLSAWSCSEVYMRVNLDAGAAPGLQLANTAVIAASNDLEADDNEATMEHPASVPYADLAIEQSWHWGALVPGGHARYGLNFHNQGNVPAPGPVQITATLPAGTSFDSWDSWGWTMVTLVEATGGYVVWEVGGLDNGYHGTIELALDIALDVEPGAYLITQAEIAAQPDEIDLANNHSVWEETIYEHGPNLRLRKYGDWHGHGEGHNAWYRLEVENVGDQAVSDVTIADNYPAEMALEGEPGVGYDQAWSWMDHPGSHFFTVTLESLEPTWVVPIDVNVMIPDPDPVPLGLVFTNLAEVNVVSGESNPEDNEASFVLATGPDLFVEKVLETRDPQPGDLVTFKLTFGNDQPGHAWWWNAQGNVYLVDTLPPGMTYVSASQRWCGPEVAPWCERDPDLVIDERTLIWNTGATGAGNWNEILLTVRLTEDVSAPGVFTNWATMTSDRPNVDVEPFYDNNSSSVSITIGHYGYLPVIFK